MDQQGVPPVISHASQHYVAALIPKLTRAPRILLGEITHLTRRKEVVVE